MTVVLSEPARGAFRTDEDFAFALESDPARIVCPDEFAVIAGALATDVHFFTGRIEDCMSGQSDAMSGNTRLRVVMTKLTFVHSLSRWLA